MKREKVSSEEKIEKIAQYSREELVNEIIKAKEVKVCLIKESIKIG